MKIDNYVKNDNWFDAHRCHLSHLFYNTFSNTYENIGDSVSYKIEECTYNEGEENEFIDLIIYFQGSEGENDWKANFKFYKKVYSRRPYKGMETKFRVHAGFLECWKQVEDIIKEKIKNPLIKRITICGYSHGAALAVLCHECCWFNRRDIANNNQLYTFAFEAPRVYASFRVKKSLKERWNNCFVFRNSNDIVTHLPPVLFGYTHVGTLVKIGRRDKYKFMNSISAHHPEKVYNALKDYQKFYKNI